MAEEPLRPEYFVTRTDGKMVPLIAVDELPYHIVIGGVNRVMSPFDIVGMTSVGRSSPRHRYHEVLEAAELAAGNQVAGGLALKARFLLTRDSGNMVPLVAMDEMPEYFVVDGVPREVSPYEIAGMTCAGVSPVRDRPHLVEDVNMVPLSYAASRIAEDRESNEHANILNTPDPLVMEEPLTAESSADPFVIPSTRIAITTPPTPTSEAATPSMATLSPTDNIERPQTTEAAANQANNSHKSHVQFIPGRKTVCSFWIRRGECDYSQQGCMFLHEMPLDVEGLKAVGLRDIPRWYREKHGLGSFLAAGGSGAGFGDEDLRSATALGVHNENREVKLPGHLASDWHAVPREQNLAPPPIYNRRGNLYDLRASRTHTPRGNLSNPFSARSTPPMISGLLRSNETMQSRQQLNTLHQMDVHARAENHRQEQAANRRGAMGRVGQSGVSTARGASEANHNRRLSASTMTSDIEAAALRQDAERRAREDADYAGTTVGEGRGSAAQGTTASVRTNVDRSGASRGGVGRAGRGGKAKRTRGSGRLSAGSSRDAA